MSYTQNNPFSRKSSPCAKRDEKSLSEIRKQPGSSNAGKYPGVTEFCGPAGGAAKGTYPVNTKGRISAAKSYADNAPNPSGIIACADKAAKKEGMSRESSQEKYMPIEDDMHKKGEGDMGMSRQPWGGNKHDYKRRDVEGVMKKTGDVDGHYKDYEGPSRKSSSSETTRKTVKRLKPDYSDYEKQQKRHHEKPSQSVDERSGNRFPGVREGQRDATTFIKSHPQYISKEKWANATDEQKDISSSPLNNTGMTGLNYSKELRYMPIEDDMHRGMSRESSSPLDYGSWAHEDAMRAKDLYKKGDYAHARALGIDEHDADYAKHWYKGEAEHGPSRHAPGHLSAYEGVDSKSLHPYDDGAGGIDYERMAKDSTNTEKKMMMTKNIKPLPKKMMMTKKLTKIAKPKSGGPR